MATAGRWQRGSVLRAWQAHCLGLALAAGSGMSCGGVELTSQQDFTINAWHIEEGRPQDSVKSLAPIPDGYSDRSALTIIGTESRP
jgi:hypothetical protein